MDTSGTHRPALIVTAPSGSQTVYELASPTLRIGRAAECEVQLDTNKVSRVHAILEQTPTGLDLRDLGSTNGTEVDGQRLGQQPITVTAEHTITLGGYSIRIAPTVSADNNGSTGASAEDDVATQLFDSDIQTLLRADPTLLQSDDFADSVITMVARGPHSRITIREAGNVRSVALTQPTLSIGRSQDCGIVIADPQASKQHGEISQIETGYRYRDLNSSNGSFINGVRQTDVNLKTGDLIRVGETQLQLVQTHTQAQPDAPGQSRRPVLLIPGFAATELWKEDVKVWPNLRRALSLREKALLEEWSGPLRLGQLVREPAIIPGLAKNDSFGSLVSFFTDELGYKANEDLLEFPYDWRQSLTDTVAQLQATLLAWRQQQPQQPAARITIVAHSMGGLIARALLNEPLAADTVERCILLGTPHQGSGVALSVALGAGQGLPFKFGSNRIQKLALNMPAFHHLLPSSAVARFADQSAFLPLETNSTWLQPEHRHHLAAARTFHQNLKNAPTNGVPLTCIFGYRQKTLETMVVEQRGNQITVTDTQHGFCGDGFVTETSAVLPQAEIHPVDQHHGVLFSDPDVLKRLRYELVERS